jgi:hypothetical protein
VRSVAAAALVAAAVAVAGCGEDPKSEPLAPERAPESGPRVDGLSQKDARMARDVAAYFKRNSVLYDQIDRIAVRDGVVTIETSLRLSGRLEGEAADICNLLQGSDVADFTPGHTVKGRGASVTCPHRND